MRPSPLYQTNADRLVLEASVLDARPGAVLLGQCIVFPGGGGQLQDIATLQSDRGEAVVTAITPDARGWWHSFEGPAIGGSIRKVYFWAALGVKLPI